MFSDLAQQVLARHQKSPGKYVDVSLELIAKAANQYKALQDRFRQARTLLAVGDYTFWLPADLSLAEWKSR